MHNYKKSTSSIWTFRNWDNSETQKLMSILARHVMQHAFLWSGVKPLPKIFVTCMLHIFQNVPMTRQSIPFTIPLQISSKNHPRHPSFIPRHPSFIYVYFHVHWEISVCLSVWKNPNLLNICWDLPISSKSSALVSSKDLFEVQKYILPMLRLRYF